MATTTRKVIEACGCIYEQEERGRHYFLHICRRCQIHEDQENALREAEIAEYNRAV